MGYENFSDNDIITIVEYRMDCGVNVTDSLFNRYLDAVERSVNNERNENNT